MIEAKNDKTTNDRLMIILNDQNALQQTILLGWTKKIIWNINRNNLKIKTINSRYR
jgi:hypothetical protein